MVTTPHRKKKIRKIQLSDLGTDSFDIFLNNQKLFRLLYSHVTSATLIPSTPTLTFDTETEES
jgi:hypothetical protein